MTVDLNLDLPEHQPADTDKPFTFQFGGHEFECRSPNEMDARRLRDLIEGAEKDPALQLAWMLGEEQWDVLDAIEATFTIQHLSTVTDRWLAHHGMSLPNSGGSRRSSKTIKSR